MGLSRVNLSQKLSESRRATWLMAQGCSGCGSSTRLGSLHKQLSDGALGAKHTTTGQELHGSSAFLSPTFPELVEA